MLEIRSCMFLFCSYGLKIQAVSPCEDALLVITGRRTKKTKGKGTEWKMRPVG